MARSWAEVVARASHRLRALLAGVEAGPLDADPVVLHAPARSMGLIEPQREAVERLIGEATGRRVRVEIRERAADEARPEAQTDTPRPEVSVTDHPLVRAAMEAFDGTVGRVTPKRPSES
ncbi:MAG: hypothetical protein KJZ54_12080 [Phycisphaerales bacterium]|nr:hypothetical protein [Phycisphaerales bacterium]